MKKNKVGVDLEKAKNLKDSNHHTDASNEEES
jgi:hypothetical protein